MRKGWLVVLFSVLFLASSLGLFALEANSAEAGLHNAVTTNAKKDNQKKRRRKAPTKLKKGKVGTKTHTRTTTLTMARHRRNRYVNQRRPHTYIHMRRSALHHPPKYYHYHYYNRRLDRSYHPYYHFDAYMVYVWGPSWKTRFRYAPSWRFAPLASLVTFSTYFTRSFDRPYRVTQDGDYLFIHPWETSVAGYYYDTAWNKWVVIDGHGRQFYFDTFEDGIEELPPTIVISGWYVSGGTYIYF